MVAHCARETSEIRAPSVDGLKLLPCTVVLECIEAVENIQQEKLKEKYKSLRLFWKLFALELSVWLINLIKNKTLHCASPFPAFLFGNSVVDTPPWPKASTAP